MKWTTRLCVLAILGAPVALASAQSCTSHEDCEVGSMCDEIAGDCVSGSALVPRLDEDAAGERLGSACAASDDDYFNVHSVPAVPTDSEVEEIIQLGLQLIMHVEHRRNPIFIIAKSISSVRSTFYRHSPNDGPYPVIEYNPAFIRRLLSGTGDAGRYALLFLLAHEYVHLQQNDTGYASGWYVPLVSEARETDGTSLRHHFELEADRGAMLILVKLGGSTTGSDQLFAVLDQMGLGEDSLTHPSTERRRTACSGTHRRAQRYFSMEIEALRRIEARLTPAQGRLVPPVPT